jgi:PBP1b-binding outer membrane lipoprotein LpoB
MKKLFLLIITVVLLHSCKDEVKPKVDVSNIPIQFEVERFDQVF